MTSQTSPPDSVAPRPGHALRRAVVRFLIATAVGVLTDAVMAIHHRWAVALVAGWDAATLLMLVLSWAIIVRSDAEATRARAAAEDPGRTAVWVLVCVASAVGLFASAVVLRGAKGIAPEASGELVALCLAAVGSAWALTHTAFTLRYAHLYYRTRDGEGGLEFPGNEPPDDLDFSYFAFTIGMCFQVSDVVVTSRVIRRTVLVHALLAFAYNTAILALALNLFFNLLG